MRFHILDALAWTIALEKQLHRRLKEAVAEYEQDCL